MEEDVVGVGVVAAAVGCVVIIVGGVWSFGLLLHAHGSKGAMAFSVVMVGLALSSVKYSAVVAWCLL